MLSCFKPRHLLWVLPAVAAAQLVGCSGSPSAPSAPPSTSTTQATPGNQPVPPAAPIPGGTGTLSVKITDSPFSDAKALLITFSEVSVHTSDGNWVTLPFAGDASARTCDLKRLVGAEDVLGTGPLDPGHYTQLRLTVSSATIYFARQTTDPSACAPTMTLETGTEVGTAVDVPSGTVKLVREFDVTGSTTTTILLDFDGDKSVHQTGNGAYKMQPVIKVVSVR
jgi:hypothetical protein